MEIEGGPDRKIRRMPDVFDANFPLPDTQYVQFIFKDRADMGIVADAFSKSHVGEGIAVHLREPFLIVPRSGGKDTARLFLDFLHELADEGTIEKVGVDIRGLNAMPE